ncbi:membrane-bound lytic murein transglycosylase MltF [Mangrovibacter plantisponsor]|uniref:membrane-bound lytic murein transglycosylase MltF n=1 Tax=Mangrovibacter plantisponsor TaxID=451513 RepID=UPI000D71AAE5|nr:membrane-bound lytic murein transglycosylase MltF [Mangrovibacter plantisponsor]
MKKLKINYLLIGVVTLLLAVALWPSISWLGKAENEIAGIQSRGVLRVSTISSPLTWNSVNGKPDGLDYQLASEFADYLGVKLEVTVRQNVNQLFDDLDSGKADILAAGLIYSPQRTKNYQAGPTYYSVSQQMVYRMGSPHPRSLGGVKPGELVLSPGQAVIDDLKALKETHYPDLTWQTDARHNMTTLMEQVVEGKINFTIADSVAISVFQRVHPQLAIVQDVTDEQPVTWFSRKESDGSLPAAMLDFFNRMGEDGTLARLEEKYLGHVGDFDYVDTRTFLRAIDNILPDLRPLFEKYATGMNWELLAAISYQESHWDPLATSPTGVRGLMMLTRNTAQSMGLSDRLDPEQSISGGARYLSRLMDKIPQTIPEDERIWFALAAYNMGYAHMMDARALTARQKGNPDSWSDVKQRLPLLSQKRYYSKTTYGYARGNEAYKYVENIRRYQLSLAGYLREKEKVAQSDQNKTQLAELMPDIRLR